jgi:protein OS-9
MQAPVSTLFLSIFCEVCVTSYLYHAFEILIYFFRLFQEERPIWYTIDCNVLPKDYKDAKVRQENGDMEIVMVTDSEINDSKE